jgi:hypothetical protein
MKKPTAIKSQNISLNKCNTVLEKLHNLTKKTPNSPPLTFPIKYFPYFCQVCKSFQILYSIFLLFTIFFVYQRCENMKINLKYTSNEQKKFYDLEMLTEIYWKSKHNILHEQTIFHREYTERIIFSSNRKEYLNLFT